MQHRRLRLGDILDDYCPRERRITNHAIVAIVGDGVKQTRCITCDAEHEYKQARIPPARRKRLGGGVPGAPEGTLRPRTAAGEEDEAVDQPGEDEAVLTEDDDQDAEQQAADAGGEPGAEAETEADVQVGGAAGAGAPDDAGEDEERPAEDDGPVHRRLIRATLPRPEGQMPERKEPEFTIRQPGGRPGGRGRPGGGRGPQRPGGGGGGQPRFGQGGPRQGGGAQGQGQGRPYGGNRPGAPGGHRGGGRPGGQGGQGQGQGQGRGGGGGRKRGR